MFMVPSPVVSKNKKQHGLCSTQQKSELTQNVEKTVNEYPILLLDEINKNRLIGHIEKLTVFSSGRITRFLPQYQWTDSLN